MWKEIKNIDHLDKSEIETFQLAALQKHLRYIIKNSPYYQEVFKRNGIDDQSLKSFADLSKFPTTTKEDLERENEKFICVDTEQIVEYVTTSGTLGTPITIALTRDDLERLAHNEKRSLLMAGITKKDTVQITTTLDKMFMAGMAYYLGAVALGAAVIRTGIGNLGVQYDNILRFKPTVSIGVPSFLNKLSNYGMQINLNPNHTSLKKAICIGEPLRNHDFTPNKLHQKITKNWDIELFSTYASTEMMTAFTECEAKQGGHLIPELVIVEILDESGNNVKDGELGEVTITPLSVQAMPLLRYRTGDLARIHKSACACNRNTLRLGPVEGRKRQMIKLKGTTIFPQAIENVLLEFEEAELHVIELLSEEDGTDRVNIFMVDVVSENVLEKIKEKLSQVLRVTPDLTQIPDYKLLNILFPRSSRKPMKVLDNREKS